MLHTVSGGWGGLGNSALAGLIGGGIWLLFWISGGMGAGDVKLMAAVGCMTGLAPLPTVVLSVAFAGAILAIAFSVHCKCVRTTAVNVAALMAHHSRHGLEPHDDLNLQNADTLRLPFALPIAAGCLFTLCAAIWKGQP